MVHTANETWDLAGFTDLQSRLGRLVPTGKLLVFNHIWLDEGGQHLRCDDRGGTRAVRPSPELFDEFLQLADAPASTISQYARKWGLLFLDLQGRPCTLTHTVRMGRDRKALPRSEPLDSWRYFSRRARAVLNIAARLHQGKSGNATDWAALDVIDDRIGSAAVDELGRRRLLDLYCHFGCPLRPGSSLTQQRRFVAFELMLWLDLTRPGFALQPTADSWRVEIDYNQCLLAAIALQLALTVAGARTLFTCSGCGMAYVREKAAKTGQANFCPACGRKEALRQADRRRRQKIVEARRLHEAGRSVREIVQELQIRKTTRAHPDQTVRRWIGKTH